jgi:ADP-heptose:LPS heptosyltransferase
MVLGGRDEANLARDLKEIVARGRLIDIAGKVDLLAAYACLKRARLFIGNDSGAMHLAAAAGIPTLGLFGPSDERQYGPYGVHAHAVRGSRSFEQIRAQDPKLNQAICHMMDLSVETVLHAAEALLAETAVPEAANA